jgi:cytochrome c peroxidase
MRYFVTLALVLLIAVPAMAQEVTLQAEFDGFDRALLNELGSALYFDTNLSTPPGQACASCHTPEAGFVDPNQALPVSDGAIAVRFGNRNAPSAGYAAFSPNFYFNTDEGLYMGGQFWDGRAANLIEQAKGPFLNPLEMNMGDKKLVVRRVQRGPYADLFLQVFGPDAFADPIVAYDNIALAIAAFESSPVFSKYDAYLAGEADLTAQVAFGLELYEGKAMCNACHPSEVGPMGEKPLFTDFSYDNLGVPSNPDNPFLYLPPYFNPDGTAFIDPGLGGFVGDPAEMGKHKVPTLRNIALTGPYMHNGFFTNLRDVVDFYNSRDVAAWPPPEVAANVNVDELGNLGLTAEEVDAVTAFLMTLTDGWVPGMNMAAIAPPAADVRFESGVTVSPNPFNPRTEIQFALDRTAAVNLDVFDVRGRRVAQLLSDSSYPAGQASIAWDARGIASGTYFMRLSIDGVSTVKRVTLVK